MKKKQICNFLLLLLLNNAVAQKMPVYGENPAAAKKIYLRGIDFYLEEYGKGLQLILLHGNGGSISSMSSIIPSLSKKFHVYAVDSRSHGRSVDPKDSLSFEMMADDVSEIISNLKLDSVYVVGWSDGGIVALELAMRHPAQVRKMAITGANLWPDSTAILPSLWTEENDYYQKNKNKEWSTEKEKNDWKLFLLDWFQPNITLRDLESIHNPVLVIAGDRDIIRIDHTVQIFQHIPAAHLWIVPNSRHGTLVEHPVDFSENVIRFFLN